MIELKKVSDLKPIVINPIYKLVYSTPVNSSTQSRCSSNRARDSLSESFKDPILTVKALPIKKMEQLSQAMYRASSELK